MPDRPSLGVRLAALGSRLSDGLTQSGPPLAWTLRGYRRDQLGKDGIGGLTVAALIVPLSIGYAQVAGLPPEAGLYASLVPLIAYAIFGSSRRLIVGPDAATAALVGAAIAPLAVAADDRIRMASALALLVALVFIAMRLAALGFLSEFLSRPLLVGYMTGIGINVAIGQIPKILGGSPFAEFLTVLGGTDIRNVEPGAILGALGDRADTNDGEPAIDRPRRTGPGGDPGRRTLAAARPDRAAGDARRAGRHRRCWTCRARASASWARSRPGCRPSPSR